MIGPIKFEDIRPGQTVRRTCIGYSGYKTSVEGIVEDRHPARVDIKGFGVIHRDAGGSWALIKDVPKPPSKVGTVIRAVVNEGTLILVKDYFGWSGANLSNKGLFETFPGGQEFDSFEVLYMPLTHKKGA